MDMPDLPVLISGLYPYEVKYGSPEEMRGPGDEPGEEDYGTFNAIDQSLSIREDITPLHAKVTFLHECLHGWTCAQGFQLPEKLEEHLVEGLSTFLLQFLRDNPLWIGWLQSKDT